ncbi:gamma-glutamylcyclotransferase family protein [Cobetia amphilecti]|uniref:Gamma-glutamylcyclotransferase n=1 Tax=Cobetia amphilecti TaxID=1055104 RepID=A0ABT6UTJ3_9GAMM|nr:gamma-glutamylcyclotransferase family protein [Cobetia amphilecti]MDI5885104.1 gamma-glutamylcyclotransferase [Cobetia amphilecti]
MAYYFAYGSNMNPARVEARIGETRRAVHGWLQEHRLSFDKASRVDGIAHANVQPAPGERVEGVLYELLEAEQITLMDPFEGRPHEYERFLHPIVTREGVIDAWVYVALPERTAEGLKPAREYLEHLLGGRDFLTPDYFTALTGVEAVHALDDATLAQLGLSRTTPR